MEDVVKQITALARAAANDDEEEEDDEDEEECDDEEEEEDDDDPEVAAVMAPTDSNGNIHQSQTKCPTTQLALPVPDHQVTSAGQ